MDVKALHNSFLSRHRAELQRAAAAHLSTFSQDNGRHERKAGDATPRARFGAVAALERLQRVSLCDLRPGTAVGSFIRGRLVVEPFIQAGLVTVFEDAETGECQRLSVYNAGRAAAADQGQPRADAGEQYHCLLRAFAEGREIAVREPFLKTASDGLPLIRVDSPSDVVFLASNAPSPAPRSDGAAAAGASCGGGAAQGPSSKGGRGKKPSAPRGADPETAEGLNEAAGRAYARDDWPEAERLYGLAMARDPASPKYPSNRAAARLKMGRYAEAFADASKAAKLDPRWHRPVLRRAEALRGQKLHDQAVPLYEKALFLLPNNAAGASCVPLSPLPPVPLPPRPPAPPSHLPYLPPRSSLPPALPPPLPPLLTPPFPYLSPPSLSPLPRQPLPRPAPPPPPRPSPPLPLLPASPSPGREASLAADRAEAEKGLHACRAALSRAAVRMQDSEGSLQRVARRRAADFAARLPAITRALEEGTAEQRRLFELVRESEAELLRSRAARDAGDIARQLVILRRAAGAGSAAAMNELWVTLSGGQGAAPGTPLDFEEAHRWLREAVEKPVWVVPGLMSNPGVAEALNATGVSLRDGIGRPADPAAAAAWFRRAAETGTGDPGHLCALCNIGFALSNGVGVAKDPAEAARFLRIGAEEWEYAPAQARPPRSRSRLGLWPAPGARAAGGARAGAAGGLRGAARGGRGGLPEAMRAVAAAYLTGKDGAPAQDEAAGRAWLERAASLSCPEAQLSLARLVLSDAAEARDGAKAAALSRRAAELLRRAAQRDCPAACYEYGMALAAGTGVPADRQMALRWLKRARKLGSREAAAVLEDGTWAAAEDKHDEDDEGERGGREGRRRRKAKPRGAGESLRAWEVAKPEKAAPAGASLHERILKMSLDQIDGAVRDPERADAMKAEGVHVVGRSGGGGDGGGGDAGPAALFHEVALSDEDGSDIDPYNLPGLERRVCAAAGSRAAARLARARRPRDRGIALLTRATSEAEARQGVRLLAEAARLDEKVVTLPACLFPVLQARPPHCRPDVYSSESNFSTFQVLVDQELEADPDSVPLRMLEIVLRLRERTPAESARVAVQLARGPGAGDPHALLTCAALRFAADDAAGALAEAERAAAAVRAGGGRASGTRSCPPAETLYHLGAARHAAAAPDDEAEQRRALADLRAFAAAAAPTSASSAWPTTRPAPAPGAPPRALRPPRRSSEVLRGAQAGWILLGALGTERGRPASWRGAGPPRPAASPPSASA
eukprot:tig00001239_g7770.t1